MTAEPGNGETPAAAVDRGHLRASHADREQVIATLKAAFVQGRLTKDELDARAGQTFAARTYADLAVITADLPAGLITAPPPRKAAPVRARPPTGRRLPHWHRPIGQGVSSDRPLVFPGLDRCRGADAGQLA